METKRTLEETGFWELPHRDLCLFLQILHFCLLEKQKDKVILSLNFEKINKCPPHANFKSFLVTTLDTSYLPHFVCFTSSYLYTEPQRQIVLQSLCQLAKLLSSCQGNTG